MDTPDHPVIAYPGDPLSLAVPRPARADVYHRWMMDPDTARGLGNRWPHTVETHRRGWESGSGSNSHPFELIDSTGGGAGIVKFDADDFVRSAEWTIYLAPEARGRGYAAEAARLSLAYAFDIAQLHSVWLRVLEPNKAAIRAYEKGGFRHAGVLRRGGYWGASPCDLVIMDAIPTDR